MSKTLYVVVDEKVSNTYKVEVADDFDTDEFDPPWWEGELVESAPYECEIIEVRKEL